MMVVLPTVRSPVGLPTPSRWLLLLLLLLLLWVRLSLAEPAPITATGTRAFMGGVVRCGDGEASNVRW